MSFVVEIHPSVWNSVEQIKARSNLKYLFLKQTKAEWEGVSLTPDVQVGITHSSFVSPEDPDADEHGCWFSAFVNISVEVRDSEQNPCMTATATYMLRYDLLRTERPTNEHLQWFAKAFALADVWPYARDLFASLASRMDIPLPPFPLLRINADDAADAPPLVEMLRRAEAKPSAAKREKDIPKRPRSPKKKPLTRAPA